MVLRCEDDPASLVLDPWTFPILPSLKPKGTAKSGNGATAKQSKKQTKKGKPEPELEEDEKDAFFSIFDGAGDEPPRHTAHPHGLDGHYDDDEYYIPRPRQRPKKDGHYGHEDGYGDRDRDHRRDQYYEDRRNYHKADPRNGRRNSDDRLSRTSSDDTSPGIHQAPRDREEAELRKKLEELEDLLGKSGNGHKDGRVHFSSPTPAAARQYHPRYDEPRPPRYDGRGRDSEHKTLDDIRKPRKNHRSPSPSPPWGRSDGRGRESTYDYERRDHGPRYNSPVSVHQETSHPYIYRGDMSTYGYEDDEFEASDRTIQGRDYRPREKPGKRSSMKPAYDAVPPPSSYKAANQPTYAHHPTAPLQQPALSGSAAHHGYSVPGAPAGYAQPQMPGAWSADVTQQQPAYAPYPQAYPQVQPPAALPTAMLQLNPPMPPHAQYSYFSHDGTRHPQSAPYAPAVPSMHSPWDPEAQKESEIAKLRLQLRRLGADDGCGSHRPPPYRFEPGDSSPESKRPRRRSKHRPLPSSSSFSIATGGSGKESKNNGWGGERNWGDQDKKSDKGGGNDENGWPNDSNQASGSQPGAAPWDSSGDNGDDNNPWGGNNDGSSNKSESHKSEDHNDNNDNSAGWGGGGGANNDNGWGDDNDDKSKDKEKSKKSDKSKSKSKDKKKKKRRGSSASSSSSSEEEKPYTRSYWTTQVKSGKEHSDANSGRKREKYTMPEDPIYTISKTEAEEKNLKHQVRGGKGAEQQRKKGTMKPLYWDNFDAPYAVFRFKYRSRGKLLPCRCFAFSLHDFPVCR